MPRGKYTRRKASMEAVADLPPAAPESEQPSSDAAFQDTVLGLLQQMTQKLQSLDERVSTVEQTGPKFVPMTPETYSADHERYQIAEMSPTDRVPRSKTVPVTTDGIRIPDAFLSDHPARFGPGMIVRLNLDAVPHGRTDGKTRGELMAEANALNAPGEVIDRTFLTKVKRADGRRGTWKYRCKFPREVVPGATLGIVSLHEPELIPA